VENRGFHGVARKKSEILGESGSADSKTSEVSSVGLGGEAEEGEGRVEEGEDKGDSFSETTTTTSTFDKKSSNSETTDLSELPEQAPSSPSPFQNNSWSRKKTDSYENIKIYQTQSEKNLLRLCANINSNSPEFPDPKFIFDELDSWRLRQQYFSCQMAFMQTLTDISCLIKVMKLPSKVNFLKSKFHNGVFFPNDFFRN
jgi:hypothetical protein